MILVFDLDDTLYDELTYVKSGFSAVARFVGDSFGLDSSDLLDGFLAHLASEGRGSVFDSVLKAHGLPPSRLVDECVAVYRSHVPDLEPYGAATRALDALADYPLYLVTDGYPMVQQTKILSLGLKGRFDETFITSAFGAEYEKPALRCFEMIAALGGGSLASLCYIGDNPAKDFVGLNRAGGVTVRVRTGQHAGIDAKPGYDAQHTIDDLDSFVPEIVKSGVLSK